MRADGSIGRLYSDGPASQTFRAQEPIANPLYSSIVVVTHRHARVSILCTDRANLYLLEGAWKALPSLAAL